MTDFYSVLKRAVSSLPDGSGPQRRAVYDKARKALLKQLQSFDPPLPSSEVTAQRLALEDAIRKIENEIARQIRTRRAVANSTRQGSVEQPPARDRPAAAAPGTAVATVAPHSTALEKREAVAGEGDQAEALESALSADAQPTEAEPLSLEDTPAAAEPLDAEETDRRSHDAADASAERRQGPVDEEDPWFEERHPAGQYDTIPPAQDLSFDEEVAETPARTAEPEVARDEDQAFARERAGAPEVDDDVAELRPARGEDTVLADDEDEPVAASPERRRGRRGGRRRAAAAQGARAPGSARSVLKRAALPVLVLALLVGASYAAYTQRVTLLAIIDDLNGTTDAPAQPRQPVVAAEPGVNKNTDRIPSVLEGESVRTAPTTTVRSAPTTDERTALPETSQYASNSPAQEATEEVTALVTPPDAAPPQVEDPTQETEPDGPVQDFTPTGNQQAVLYEEADQAGEQGSATPGEVEWEMVRQAIGGGDPQPVVRAEALVAEKGMEALLTIRKNDDDALPASHLIEIELSVPEGTGGGGVQSVPGLIMKETEDSRGTPLRAAAARVSDGLFWIALSQTEADRNINLALLRERDWIDIPIIYKSGRRAILTLRKGTEGYTSVNNAIQAWSPG